MKRFIRGAGVVFFFAFFGLSALFVRYFVFPFIKTKHEDYDMLRKLWKFFVGILCKVKIINVKVDEIEKLKNIKNSIIVSTHPSYIDILLLISIIPNSTCFVAQKLANNLFFKDIVDLLFILDSNNIDEWLNKACEKLNNGLNIIIFPMGSRHDKNEHPKIRRGASLIAFKSQRNIVALNIETSYRFLSINQPIYDVGDKTVDYKIEYLDEINIKDFLAEYPDEVSFKTEVTRKISNILYKYK